MTTRVQGFEGVRHDTSHERRRLVADVQYYLTLSPRQLPSRYFYDALGSALFDAICRLPWYGVTRAENRLLVRYRSEIFARSGSISTLVELGSGSGEKLRTLLEAPTRGGHATVHLVDVSAAALESALGRLADVFGLTPVAHQAEYEDGLVAVSRARRTGRALALFLGSNIGNFDRPGAESLLGQIRATLREGDRLLLGADLVKPERDLLLAYDDPLGVTAAFNRNILIRLNTELDADFDLERFSHRAVWNPAESRVEMHLVSIADQRVRLGIAELEIDLFKGESIWTESSYKYRPDEIVALVEHAGFRCSAQWIDDEDPFALTLFQAT